MEFSKDSTFEILYAFTENYFIQYVGSTSAVLNLK